MAFLFSTDKPRLQSNIHHRLHKNLSQVFVLPPVALYVMQSADLYRNEYDFFLTLGNYRELRLCLSLK